MLSVKQGGIKYHFLRLWYIHSSLYTYIWTNYWWLKIYWGPRRHRGCLKKGETTDFDWLLSSCYYQGEVGEMSRRLETDYIQPQQTVPLFTEGKLKGSNIKSLPHFKMIKQMWPTQNIESVDINVCHAFPAINHVVCYGRPGCVYKQASFKLKILNTSCFMHKSNRLDVLPM